VDDDEDIDYDNISLDEEEEDNVKEKKTPKKKVIKRNVKIPVKKQTTKEPPELNIDQVNTLNYESELSEEEYM
jgi:hypothetical protein